MTFFCSAEAIVRFSGIAMPRFRCYALAVTVTALRHSVIKNKIAVEQYIDYASFVNGTAPKFSNTISGSRGISKLNAALRK